MIRLDEFSCPEINRRNLCLALSQKALEQSTADTNDANPGHVSFEQRVCRLRCAMRDKNNLFWLNIVFCQTFVKRRHNTGRHTTLVMMRRHHRSLADNLVGFIVDGNRLGVCSTHIDTDTNSSTAHNY